MSSLPETQSPPSIHTPAGGNGSDEEGLALRKWRRRNAIELGEKERKEKEKLKEIIEEAEAYKVEFYRKREMNVEKKKGANRETERVFLENQEKFHAEAVRNYWKAVAEMIPREVAAVEKRGKKEMKGGSVVVVHGPKPGKPTDRSRMRQILVKLKQSPHIKQNAERLDVA